jgi:multidrug efflux pump subunit AcrB
LIILASIPLAIIAAVLVLYMGGETLNTMTLGGFALAVGILVDNGTVVIENIERHVSLGEPLEESILQGTAEVGVPTFLATLSISVVFVPVFLLTGTAKYLFSPLSLSVIISLVASLLLSFTLVPLLFKYLMRSQVHAHGDHAQGHQNAPAQPARRRFNPFGFIHRSFERGFLSLREGHRNTLAWHGFLPADRRGADALACSCASGNKA